MNRARTMGLTIPVFSTTDYTDYNGFYGACDRLVLSSYPVTQQVKDLEFQLFHNP